MGTRAFLYSHLYDQLKNYGSNPTTKRKPLNSLHNIKLMHAAQHLKMSDEDNLDDDKARETNHDGDKQAL